MESSAQQQLQRIFEENRLNSRLPPPLLLGVTVSLSLLAALGVVGNLLVIAFFHRSLRDLPQNVYVIALASLDLAVCAVGIPSTIYQDVWREPSTDAMCKAFNIARCSTIVASAFLLCLIAVDRFCIICFVPGIQTSRRSSVAYIGLVLTAGLAVGTPIGLATGTGYRLKVNTSALNGYAQPLHRSHCISDYSLISKRGLEIYKNALTLLFVLTLLLVVFFYLNIFLFVKRRQHKWSRVRAGGGACSRMEQLKPSGRPRRSEARLEDTEVTSCDPPVSPWHRQQQHHHQHHQQQHDRLLETDIDEALSNRVGNGGAARSVNYNCDGSEREDSALTEQMDKEAGREASAAAGGFVSERTRKRPHIKTAKVLSVITLFYILSYLPFFLAFHLQRASAYNSGWAATDESVRVNETLVGWQEFSAADTERLHAGNGSRANLLMHIVFYCYFINHAVNPIIYGCMNTYFKQQVCGLYNSMRFTCPRP